jgi:hypothetical protein
MRSPTQLPRPSSQNRLIGQQLSLDSVLVDDSRQHPHMQHAVRIYHGSGFAEQDQLEATRQQQQQDWGPGPGKAAAPTPPALRCSSTRALWTIWPAAHVSG